MKKLILLILFIQSLFPLFGQNSEPSIQTDSLKMEGRDLESTKAYIEKTLNSAGYWTDSKKRIQVKFEDDLMRLTIVNSPGASWLLDFSVLHRMYPVKVPPKSQTVEILGMVSFWVAIRRGKDEMRVDKEKFELGVKNAQLAEEVRSALLHLNMLLIEKAKLDIEKF